MKATTGLGLIFGLTFTLAAPALAGAAVADTVVCGVFHHSPPEKEQGGFWGPLRSDDGRDICYRAFVDRAPHIRHNYQSTYPLNGKQAALDLVFNDRGIEEAGYKTLSEVAPFVRSPYVANSTLALFIERRGMPMYTVDTPEIEVSCHFLTEAKAIERFPNCPLTQPESSWDEKGQR